MSMIINPYRFGGGGGGGPSYRYWRINVTANGGSTYVSIAELEMRLTSGGANQCSGGTPNASTSFFGDNGARAFDGFYVDSNTWVSASGGPPQWVQYDFGTAKAIAEIGMWPESSESLTRAPTAFDIQGSNDGSSWTTTKSYSSVSGWVYLSEKTFSTT